MANRRIGALKKVSLGLAVEWKRQKIGLLGLTVERKRQKIGLLGLAVSERRSWEEGIGRVVSGL